MDLARIRKATGRCPTGKIRYASAPDAIAGLRRHRRLAPDPTLAVYRCPECEFWHLGHSRFNRANWR